MAALEPRVKDSQFLPQPPLFRRLSKTVAGFTKGCGTDVEEKWQIREMSTVSSEFESHSRAVIVAVSYKAGHWTPVLDIRR